MNTNVLKPYTNSSFVVVSGRTGGKVAQYSRDLSPVPLPPHPSHVIRLEEANWILLIPTLDCQGVVLLWKGQCLQTADDFAELAKANGSLTATLRTSAHHPLPTRPRDTDKDGRSRWETAVCSFPWCFYKSTLTCSDFRFSSSAQLQHSSIWTVRVSDVQDHPRMGSDSLRSLPIHQHIFPSPTPFRNVLTRAYPPSIWRPSARNVAEC